MVDGIRRQNYGKVFLTPEGLSTCKALHGLGWPEGAELVELDGDLVAVQLPERDVQKAIEDLDWPGWLDV